MELDEYRYQVSKRMLTIFGIDWAAACGDDDPLLQSIDDGDSAKEFVDWFGRKYDLDPLWLYGLKPPYERIVELSRTKRDSSSA